jgi:hypothetical protein
MTLSEEFTINYIDGLPLCGNGEPNPGIFGETQDNCCRDMGCPDGETCTIDKGCINVSEIGITALMNNMELPTIDCTDTGTDDLPKTVTLDIELVNTSSGEKIKPYSPTTDNMVTLGTDVYIGSKSISGMYGTCERESSGVNDWDCEVEVENFNPFCWIPGTADPQTVLTEMSWRDGDGNDIELDLTDTVQFVIDPANPRPCNDNALCDEDGGEVVNDCCRGCGCTDTGADFVCSVDNECVGKSTIALTIDDVSPDGIDCQSAATNDNSLSLNVEIVNAPHYIRNIRWFMDYNDDEGNTILTLDEDYFTCTEQNDYDGNPTGIYDCLMSVLFFPGCETLGDKSMTLRAEVDYRKAGGSTGEFVSVESDFIVNVGRAGLPQCGTNNNCDPGENYNNCCMDCGCDPDSDADICTENRYCVKGDQLVLEIDPSSEVPPNSLTAPCELQVGNVDFETFTIEDYTCIFQDPIELEAKIKKKDSNPAEYILPINAMMMSGSYDWAVGQGPIYTTKTYRNIIPEEAPMGWTLQIRPNPSGYYTVDKITADRGTDFGKLDAVSLNVRSMSLGGDVKTFTVSSDSSTDVSLELLKNDDVLQEEEAMERMSNALKKANRIVCIITTVLATCVACSIVAGGTLGNVTNGDDGDGGTFINIPVPMGRGGFGNIHPNMFSSLMNSMRTISETGTGVVGGFAGGLFAVAAWQVLDCSPYYAAAILGGTALCVAMLTFCEECIRAWTKVCDFLAMSVRLLDALTKIQRMIMSYQTCAVAAEMQLARSQNTQTSSLGMAQRMQNYYRQQTSCHTTASNNMENIMEAFSRFSYDMAQASGAVNPGITINPEAGTVIRQSGPEISIGIDIPADMNYYQQQGYGWQSSRYSGNRYGSIRIQMSSDSGSGFDCSGGTRRVGFYGFREYLRFNLRPGIGHITCSPVRSGLECSSSGASSTYTRIKVCPGEEYLNAAKISIITNYETVTYDYATEGDPGNGGGGEIARIDLNNFESEVAYTEFKVNDKVIVETVEGDKEVVVKSIQYSGADFDPDAVFVPKDDQTKTLNLVGDETGDILVDVTSITKNDNPDEPDTVDFKLIPIPEDFCTDWDGTSNDLDTLKNNYKDVIDSQGSDYSVGIQDNLKKFIRPEFEQSYAFYNTLASSGDGSIKYFTDDAITWTDGNDYAGKDQVEKLIDLLKEEIEASCNTGS